MQLPVFCGGSEQDSPAGCFVYSLGSASGRGAAEGHCPIAPDLAVEVVSPHDLYSEVEAKVNDYLGAGVSLVWVVDPPTRSVRVHAV